MKNIDLHMHSIYSDGSYTPAQLTMCAKKKGLVAISLTDHDTIDGLAEARKHAEFLNVRFVNGVEINSYYILDNRRINIHVLGYAFDEKRMEPYMMQLKTLRYEHNQAIMDALHAIGIDISYSDMDMQSENNIVTRLNFAKALVKKGYAKTVREALDKYLHKGGVAFVEYNNFVFSVVAKMIHDAGGVVSLAHPAEYGLDDAETENLIIALKGEGLEAIECIHPLQDAQYANKLMQLAKKHGLKITGGSDFHGNDGDGIELGLGGDEMIIPAYFLTDLNLEKVARCFELEG